MLSLHNSKFESKDTETEMMPCLNSKIRLIIENFEILTENFKAKQNFYTNYFFYFFGDHYESIINSVNFFHYATESILLEIIKKNRSEAILAAKGDDLLHFFKELSIEKENYYDNIKLLTGSCYFYDMATKISEIKIATLFLNKFNLYKEKEIANLEKQRDEVEPFNFETIFLSITQRATSSTLYELKPINIKNENEKHICDKELLFYSCLNEIKNKQNVIFMNFMKSIQNYSETNLNALNDKNMMNILKMYYFYSKTKLDNFLFDLELFGDYSTSLYEKFKKISVKNYEKFNSNFKNALKKTIPYENLKNFYNQISTKLSDSAVSVKSKISSLRLWIDESIKRSPNFFYEKFRVSQIFLYDKVLQPSKNFLVLFTDKSTTFLFTNIINVKKVSSELSNFFLEKAESYMNNLEHRVNEGEFFIRFTADEKINFVKVDLDNTIMMINPRKLKIYIDDLYNKMKEYSLELIEMSKCYIINKYKLFLGEDEKIISETMK